MELDYRAIGKRIKTARLALRLTQEALSEQAGISPTHMSNIETGTTRISLTTLVAIANALQVTSDQLLCDNVVFAQAHIVQDIARTLEDCDEYEIRVIQDVTLALKETLRRDAKLRQNNQDGESVG